MKLGKRIDERPYTLPDPEILNARPEAPLRYSASKDIVGASSSEPSSLPAAAKSPVQLNVFNKKQVMLSEDLRIGPHLIGSIQDVIERSGGQLTQEVSRADMLICCYREGYAYRTASRLNKDVGSLSWLYHLITFNTWTSPLRRLLHYPVVRGGIPEFHGKKISLSNYVGEARVYLENLIRAAGGECTKTLNMENTHLITAHGNSEKCDAAKEWGLEVVNHLWLEESYSNWRLMPVSNPRYTHFPKRTNLSEVVGQTRLDKTVLENLFFPPEDPPELSNTYSSSPASSLPQPPSPRRAMRNKNQNITVSTLPASSAMSNSVPPPARRTDSPETDGTTKPADKARKTFDGKKLATPVRPYTVGTGKENDTPSSTNSRKSKDAATARLHDLAPDIALYEKEKKRVGGVLYGGKGKGQDDNKAAAHSKKRPSTEPEPTSENEEATTGAVKKQKKTKAPVTIRLLITGYQKWLGNMKKEDADKVCGFGFVFFFFFFF